ncbi:MAG: hypothetical protein AAGA48_14165 [Myxococcota bacterium]
MWTSPNALARGVAWLVDQQSPQGHFPSQTYGFFAEGASLTPLVTLALVESGQASAAVGRARRWMAQRAGLGQGSVDYPTYAAALMGRAMADHPWDPEPLVAFLRAQQVRPDAGWSVDHPAVGGFGFGNAPPRPPNVGHVDLSMTRRAIEALVALGVAAPDPTLQWARTFVERCRAEGGGMVYTPVSPDLNKGRNGAGYGSATCDGVLALAALGVEPAEFESDLTWLRRHHTPDRNPGVAEDREPFARAMRGYYQCAASQVFARFGGPKGWSAALAHDLRRRQRDDGSWQNELPHQKEDDPLVATAFAVRTLVRCSNRHDPIQSSP